MPRTRRNFSAKFKSDLVLEVLKGEKELNVIATENDIQPNLLRNWKKEFLEKASVVFDDTGEENLKEKLSEERKEKAAYAKKVGQLTMQVDWLKKSEELLGPGYGSQFSLKPNLSKCLQRAAGVPYLFLDAHRQQLTELQDNMGGFRWNTPTMCSPCPSPASRSLTQKIPTVSGAPVCRMSCLPSA